MGEVWIKESTLTAIGDAVRAKTGASGLLAPGDMITALDGAKSHGDYLFIKKESPGGEIISYIVTDNIEEYPDSDWQDGYYWERGFTLYQWKATSYGYKTAGAPGSITFVPASNTRYYRTFSRSSSMPIFDKNTKQFKFDGSMTPYTTNNNRKESKSWSYYFVPGSNYATTSEEAESLVPETFTEWYKMQSYSFMSSQNTSYTYPYTNGVGIDYYYKMTTTTNIVTSTNPNAYPDGDWVGDVYYEKIADPA